MRIQKSIVGFTLIELSIVLVIIGLVVGGVLFGRDLIASAEIRKTIKQTEEFDAAINTFRLKYNCLPGDCKDAGSFGFTTTTSPFPTVTKGSNADGDGNGKIWNNAPFDELPVPAGPGMFEIASAWWWLQQAGLINGVKLRDGPAAYTAGGHSFIPAAIQGGQRGGLPSWNVMYLKAQGSLGFHNRARHYYWLTADVYGDNEHTLCCENFTVILPIKAYKIDKKIDDGMPRTGRVLSSGNDEWAGGAGIESWPIPISDPAVDQGPAGPNSRYCLTNDNPSQYNVQNVSGPEGGYDNFPRSSICTLTVETAF
jgi:prepilin-type N-terminal cleavage/methylation domain-containing protein